MNSKWDPGATAPPPTDVLHSLRHRMGRIMERMSVPGVHREPSPPRDPGAVPPQPEPPPPAPPLPQNLRQTVDDAGLIYRHTSPPCQTLGSASLASPEPLVLRQVEALLEAEYGWNALHCSLLEPEDFLFLDIETTGLGHADLSDEEQATGPMAFTIGLGRWRGETGGEFWVDQIFLQDPEREAEALACLRPYVERCRVLVTFNGRAFDWPVLQDRALLHRVELELEGCHLDLLAPSRRLFRSRMQDCRQQTLERSLLAFCRDSDVAGAEAPGIYWRFLHSGQWDDVIGVLEHNRLDVTCMAPLMLLLARHVADPLHWAEDSEELMAAGLMNLRAGNRVLGCACLERGLEMAHLPATRRRLLAALARERRRAGRLAEARALWERYAAEFSQYNTGWIELAKYHEHVSRDLLQAEAMARQAPRQSEDVLHRLTRLRRRLDRQINIYN